MISKGIFVLLLVSIVLVSGCVNNPPQPNVEPTKETPSAADKTYTFTDLGIKLNYPNTWTTETFLGQTRFLSKDESDYSIPTVLSVSAEDWTGTLDEYTTKYIGELTSADESTIETESATVANIEANKITFSGEGRQFVHTVFLKNGKAYSLAFGTSEDTFTKYFPDSESILGSLEFV